MSTIQLYGKLASKFFSCVFHTVVGLGLDWKLTVYFQELFFFSKAMALFVLVHNPAVLGELYTPLCPV